jgi:hypothetical protein
MVFAGIKASLEFVTAFEAIEATKEPVPEPVTSPVKLMVWSPVLVPEDEPDKLEPVTVPEAATEVGVIAPNERVIAGVVDGVATVPLIPLAVATDTKVTLPEPITAKPALRTTTRHPAEPGASEAVKTTVFTSVRSTC